MNMFFIHLGFFSPQTSRSPGLLTCSWLPGLPVVLPDQAEAVLLGAAVLGACASQDYSSVQVNTNTGPKPKLKKLESFPVIYERGHCGVIVIQVILIQV